MNKIYVDKARLFRRVIIISWITLLLCFLVKIFGGNFFEIMCENPKYKALCEYVDKNLWIKYIIGCLSSIFAIGLYLLALFKKYKFTITQLAIFIPSVLISCLVKLFNSSYGLIFDFWLMIVYPFLFLPKTKKTIFDIIIAFILNFAFQAISLLTKNLSIGFIDDSTFIGLIYMIDLYIMCWLYYLYRNYNKEMNNMGIFFVLFAGKPEDKLNAMLKKRKARLEKYKAEEKKCEAEINAIELELAKRKSGK
jgi:membrane-associated HD superfamily phosphohydrolase